MQDMMWVDGRLVEGAEHPVNANKGWGVLLVRPCVTTSMQVDVAQGMVSNEAPKMVH